MICPQGNLFWILIVLKKKFTSTYRHCGNPAHFCWVALNHMLWVSQQHWKALGHSITLPGSPKPALLAAFELLCLHQLVFTWTPDLTEYHCSGEWNKSHTNQVTREKVFESEWILMQYLSRIISATVKNYKPSCLTDISITVVLLPYHCAVLVLVLQL